MGFAHNFILENTSLHQCSFAFKKRDNYMHPQKQMKTPKQAFFHLFLLSFSYLHTTFSKVPPFLQILMERY
jgi:hypothetical protein